MILTLLIDILIIIILHEGAHAIAANFCKCPIQKITLGFGKILYQKTYKHIKYQIKLFLVGGSCTLKGELGNSTDKTSFINLPYTKKLLIAGAGCAINIIIGVICYYLGLRLNNFNMYCFGYLSIISGISNWFIPIPCLDGGYALWYPIILHKYGQQKGIRIFSKMVTTSFNIIIGISS